MLAGSELVVALFIVLLAATLMGLVSFGFGMVTSPILLLLMAPQSVVIAINSLSAITLSLVLYQTRRDVPVARTLPLAISGLAGAPLGVFILSSASPGPLRVAIASIILCLAIPSVLNFQRPLPLARLVAPAVGFLAAMLVTGLGVGIPLVALFLVNQKWSGRTIRASIAMYYLMVATEAIILYIATGLFTIERAWLVVELTPPPAALLGFGLATLLVRRMEDTALRHVVLGVIIVASTTLLGRELV